MDVVSLPGLVSLRSMMELSEARQAVCDAEAALREQQRLEDTFFIEAWQAIYNEASTPHQAVVDSVTEETSAAEALVREEFSAEADVQASEETPQELIEGPTLKPAEILTLRIDAVKGAIYKCRAGELDAAHQALENLRLKAVEAGNAAKAEVHDESVLDRLNAARNREQAAWGEIRRLTATSVRV